MFRKSIEKKAETVTENMQAIRAVFRDLAIAHASNVESIDVIDLPDGLIILESFAKIESEIKSTIPVGIDHGEKEVLFDPWPDNDEDAYDLTQTAIQYLAIRLNSFIKDESEAIKTITAFVIMFMNEENLTQAFGTDLRKKIQDIPLVRDAFKLTKTDFSDENIKDFFAKVSAYQERLQDEMDVEAMRLMRKVG